MQRQKEGPTATGLSVMCNKCRMDKEEVGRERGPISETAAAVNERTLYDAKGKDGDGGRAEYKERARTPRNGAEATRRVWALPHYPG